MEAWNTLKSYVPPVPFSPTLWPLTKNTVHTQTDQSTYATRRRSDDDVHDKTQQNDGSNYGACTLANFDRLDEAPAVTSPTKCEDSRGWVESLTDSVIFHVSLGYNLVQHDSKKQPWWDRVTDAPGIILGALPFRDKDHAEKLIAEGVGGVVILCKEFELRPNLIGTPVTPSQWHDMEVEALHIPTRDFSAPTQEVLNTAVQFMKHIICGKNKSVYVHCKAGRGRSVACVVCYLVAHMGMTTDAAIRHVQSKRAHINMGAAQVAACYQFEELCREKQNGAKSDVEDSNCDLFSDGEFVFMEIRNENCKGASCVEECCAKEHVCTIPNPESPLEDDEGFIEVGEEYVKSLHASTDDISSDFEVIDSDRDSSPSEKITPSPCHSLTNSDTAHALADGNSLILTSSPATSTSCSIHQSSQPNWNEACFACN